MVEVEMEIRNHTKDTRVNRILAILALAKSPAPLGYISVHTGIEEPLNVLNMMEEEGLVHRSLSSMWSGSTEPKFERILQ